MIVYRLTSPSSKVYFGKSSKTLTERIKIHKRDRDRLIAANKPLPRFYSAWYKYPIEVWLKDIIQSNLTIEEANDLEIQLILENDSRNPKYGYNMAKGGNGGDTGRNSDLEKRTQHAEFMRKRFKENPVLKLEATRKQKEYLQQHPELHQQYVAKRKQRLPRGNKHWNRTGLWVVNHNVYESSFEAHLSERVSIDIIWQWCNNPDQVIRPYKGKVSAGKAGITRRQAGFYRIIDGDVNGKI